MAVPLGMCTAAAAGLLICCIAAVIGFTWDKKISSDESLAFFYQRKFRQEATSTDHIVRLSVVTVSSLSAYRPSEPWFLED